MNRNFLGNFRRKKLGFNLLMIVLISFLFPLALHGEDSKAVTLLYFEGAGRDTAVLLRWATATEVDTAGFMLERSQYAAGPYRLLSNIGFVPSLAEDAFSGAEYQRLDQDNILADQSYYYVLVEFEVDGTEIRTDPIFVNSSSATATATIQSQNDSQQSTETPGSINQDGTRTPESSSTPGTVTPVSDSSMMASSNGYPSPRSDDIDEVFEGSPDSSQPGNELSDIFAQSTSFLALTPTFEGYPAPENSEDETSLGTGQSYPGPTAALGVIPSASRYPAPARSSLESSDLGQSETPASIGHSEGSSNNVSNDSSQNNQSALSTVVLWIGFLAAVAIFIAGVAGSIHLYSNMRIRNR